MHREIEMNMRKEVAEHLLVSHRYCSSAAVLLMVKRRRQKKDKDAGKLIG
jgi:hypothetical protein